VNPLYESFVKKPAPDDENLLNLITIGPTGAATPGLSLIEA